MYLYGRSDLMALIKCNECQKLISSKAKSCPNCGAPTPYGKSLMEKIMYVTIWIIALIALIVVILVTNKQNDKIVGTWIKDSTSYFLKQKGMTSIDSYTFFDDGTCVNSYESFSEFTRFTNSSSTPCKYKLKRDEIIITWLEDENDDEGEEETLSFSYGGSYIIIDDEKYEKDY